MGLDNIRKAEWLEPGRVRGYLLLLALVNAGAVAYLLLTQRGGVEPTDF